MLNDSEYQDETRIDPLELGECEPFSWFTLDLRKVKDDSGNPLFPELSDRRRPCPLWSVRPIVEYDSRMSKEQKGVAGPYSLPINMEQERQNNIRRYRQLAASGKPLGDEG